jgi:hypothetical protein
MTFVGAREQRRRHGCWTRRTRAPTNEPRLHRTIIVYTVGLMF